jgi:hypothetical protein
MQAAADPADPTRVLIVGDSVTHGDNGDYTWRYFAWQGLQASGADVDLVGPRRGTRADSGTWAGGYADPNFDQDHAARWGMSMWEVLEHTSDTAPRIGDLVAAQDPDVIVETLGVNDFVYLQLSDMAMSGQVRTFVEEARAAKPDVDIVLGSLPQTWIQGVVAYNAALPGLAAEPSTADSPVVATPVAEFVEGVDTYDAAHPTTRGQIKYASAVSTALAELGVGEPFVAPTPAVPGPHDPASPSPPAEPAEPAEPVEPVEPVEPPVTPPSTPSTPAPTIVPSVETQQPEFLEAPALRARAQRNGWVRLSWTRIDAGGVRIWVRDVTAKSRLDDAAEAGWPVAYVPARAPAPRARGEVPGCSC